VSEGAIVIRDRDNQTQDVSGLSRDVEHANQTLSPIFDKEREQNRLQEAQLIGEIGNQAADIARTEGQIAATNAANERMKAVTPGQLKAAEAEWRKANPGKEPTASDISGQAYQNFYNQAFKESGFGTGGKVQQAIQAATAAVQGLAGGNLGQAITGGSAPYLAEIIHNQTLNPDGSVNVQANLMAHAVVGAVTAYAAGNSALAGASGAAMGEYNCVFSLCGIVLEKFGGYVLLRVFAHRNRMPSENWQDRNSPSPVLHGLYILLRAPCTSTTLNILAWQNTRMRESAWKWVNIRSKIIGV